MAACIKLDHLTKNYGSTVAVNDLTLEIEAGEVFGFLGPNGAGKSTTFYMMCGLARPASGTVSIFGKELHSNFLELAPRMGVLLERPSFYDYLTVSKNLRILAKLSNKDVTIDRALDLVGMLHVSDQKVGTLSGGMRQRLGLAQAFLTEPELLILDEPTNGLDVEQTLEIVRLLRSLADDANVTIVLSSHRMDEAETLCDRIAVMNEGRLVTCAETEALISYDKTHVEVLMDTPETAARRLLQEDWVHSVEVKRGKLIVRLHEPNPHQLNTFLIGAGYQISGIIPRHRTLQDFFLKALNQ